MSSYVYVLYGRAQYGNEDVVTSSPSVVLSCRGLAHAEHHRIPVTSSLIADSVPRDS